MPNQKSMPVAQVTDLNAKYYYSKADVAFQTNAMDQLLQTELSYLYQQKVGW